MDKMESLQTQVLKEVESLFPEAVEDLSTLVRIPSITGNELEAQRWMEREMKSIGLDVDEWSSSLSELIPLPGYMNIVNRETKGRPNLVGSWSKSGNDMDKGRSLILNGHIDVVDTGSLEKWTIDPWGGDIVGDKLFGRGSCDMKAGLLAGLFAIKSLKNAGISLKGELLFQSVIGEEEGTTGSLATLAKGYKADAVVVMEPSKLAIVPVSSGVGFFQLTIKGLSAHSSIRAQGVSSIEKFILIYHGLLELEQELNEEVTDHYFTHYESPLSLNIHRVTAGDDSGTVPDQLLASGRIGFLNETEEEIRERFENKVKKICETDEWLSENPPQIEWVGKTWSATPVDQALAKQFQRTCELVMKDKPVVEGVTFRSDMHLYANTGNMPTVIFGPGDIKNAHFPNENVSLSEFKRAIEVLSLFIMNWCGVHSSSKIV